MFIDTHAHLYLDRFNEDIDQVVKSCLDHGVEQIYLPNIDRASISSMLKLEAKFPDMMFSMMGLHPCSVKENFKQELEYMESLLHERDYVAIGEVGIDLYWDKTFHKQQQEAFRIQIQWAKERDIPFVIHSRESLDETISIVEELQDGSLKGIFHCFTGDRVQAQRIMDVGFYMGIGGVLSFKNSNLREILADVDLNFLVLETDAPFLAPTPHRGKRNQSDYIPLIAKVLSESLLKNIDEIEEVTSKNALTVFGKL